LFFELLFCSRWERLEEFLYGRGTYGHLLAIIRDRVLPVRDHPVVAVAARE
jgi:hypothetical protein